VVLTVTGETRVERRRRHVLGRGSTPRDLLRRADVLEDLHRALVEHVGLRQIRRPGPRADEQVLDTKAGEQHRSRQPGAAAADHQYRRLLGPHPLLPSPIGDHLGACSVPEDEFQFNIDDIFIPY
jgi:hypothetical protein